MKSYALITPPTVEPVTLAEASAFLRLNVNTENSLVSALLAVAREVVESFTGRVLAASGWRLATESWGDGTIVIDRSPLVSVQSVKYWPADGSGQVTMGSGSYVVVTATTPGVIVMSDMPALASRPDAVQTEFTAGSPGAVPQSLRHAILLLVSHLFENRQPINIGNIVNELPFSVKHLLESHRVGGWCA